MRYDFDNKVAIITGGAKGIGKEVVQGIHNGGGTVAVLDIDNSAGKNLLGELGNNDCYYHMDQANREEVNTIFRQNINDFQTVDILVNVAGIISAKPFSDLSPEEWDQTIQTNLTGPFNTVKAIWEHFKNNKGGRTFFYAYLNEQNSFR